MTIIPFQHDFDMNQRKKGILMYGQHILSSKNIILYARIFSNPFNSIMDIMDMNESWIWISKVVLDILNVQQLEGP